MLHLYRFRTTILFSVFCLNSLTHLLYDKLNDEDTENNTTNTAYCESSKGSSYTLIRLILMLLLLMLAFIFEQQICKVSLIQKRNINNNNNNNDHLSPRHVSGTISSSSQTATVTNSSLHTESISRHSKQLLKSIFLSTLCVILYQETSSPLTNEALVVFLLNIANRTALPITPGATAVTNATTATIPRSIKSTATSISSLVFSLAELIAIHAYIIIRSAFASTSSNFTQFDRITTQSTSLLASMLFSVIPILFANTGDDYYVSNHHHNNQREDLTHPGQFLSASDSKKKRHNHNPQLQNNNQFIDQSSPDFIQQSRKQYRKTSEEQSLKLPRATSFVENLPFQFKQEDIGLEDTNQNLLQQLPSTQMRDNAAGTSGKDKLELIQFHSQPDISLLQHNSNKTQLQQQQQQMQVLTSSRQISCSNSDIPKFGRRMARSIENQINEEGKSDNESCHPNNTISAQPNTLTFGQIILQSTASNTTIPQQIKNSSSSVTKNQSNCQNNINNNMNTNSSNSNNNCSTPVNAVNFSAITNNINISSLPSTGPRPKKVSPILEEENENNQLKQSSITLDHKTSLNLNLVDSESPVNVDMMRSQDSMKSQSINNISISPQNTKIYSQMKQSRRANSKRYSQIRSSILEHQNQSQSRLSLNNRMTTLSSLCMSSSSLRRPSMKKRKSVFNKTYHEVPLPGSAKTSRRHQSAEKSEFNLGDSLSKAFFNFFPEGVAFIDESLNLLYANDSLKKFLQPSSENPSSLLAETLFDLRNEFQVQELSMQQSEKARDFILKNTTAIIRTDRCIAPIPMQSPSEIRASYMNKSKSTNVIKYIYDSQSPAVNHSLYYSRQSQNHSRKTVTSMTQFFASKRIIESTGAIAPNSLNSVTPTTITASLFENHFSVDAASTTTSSGPFKKHWNEIDIQRKQAISADLRTEIKAILSSANIYILQHPSCSDDCILDKAFTFSTRFDPQKLTQNTGETIVLHPPSTGSTIPAQPSQQHDYQPQQQQKQQQQQQKVNLNSTLINLAGLSQQYRMKSSSSTYINNNNNQHSYSHSISVSDTNQAGITQLSTPPKLIGSPNQLSFFHPSTVPEESYVTSLAHAESPFIPPLRGLPPLNLHSPQQQSQQIQPQTPEDGSIRYPSNSNGYSNSPKPDYRSQMMSPLLLQQQQSMNQRNRNLSGSLIVGDEMRGSLSCLSLNGVRRANAPIPAASVHNNTNNMNSHSEFQDVSKISFSPNLVSNTSPHNTSLSCQYNNKASPTSKLRGLDSSSNRRGSGKRSGTLEDVSKNNNNLSKNSTNPIGNNSNTSKTAQLNEWTDDEDRMIPSQKREFDITVFTYVLNSRPVIMLLVRDVTHRSYIKLLQDVTKKKSKMVSFVSHELRTPLNSIIAMLETMKGNPHMDYIETALMNSKYLLCVSNDLLDLAQIKVNKFHLRKKCFNLKELVMETMEMFEIQAARQQIELNVDYQVNVPTFVSSDKNRIRQVLINLLGNAFKFILDGSITVQVRMVQEYLFEVKVIDTGIGIKQTDLDKLFKTFGKLDAEESVKMNEQGVGLGLVISNMIAFSLSQDNQGLTVSSEYGKGTTFQFKLLDWDPQQSEEAEKALKSENEDEDAVDERENNDEQIATMSVVKKIQPYSSFEIQRSAFLKAKENQMLQQTSMIARIDMSTRGYSTVDFKNPGGQGFERNNLRQSSEMPSHWEERRKNRMSVNESSSLNYKILSLNGVGSLKRPHELTQLTKVATTQINTKDQWGQILIVDDNMSNIIAMKCLIGLIKPQVMCNYTIRGKTAEELVANRFLQQSTFGYSIIFMDIVMPEQDGITTSKNIIQFLQEHGIHNTKIIACSGYDDDDEKRNCIDVGITDYLVKPVFKEKLANVIQNYLE